MAAVLPVVVVVAFSWTHSTARVSRGYMVLTHPHAVHKAGGRERVRRVRFAKSAVKRIALRCADTVAF